MPKTRKKEKKRKVLKIKSMKPDTKLQCQWPRSPIRCKTNASQSEKETKRKEKKKENQ